MDRLAVRVTLAGLWLAALPGRTAGWLVAAARRVTSDDRGESPVTVAIITVGMVAIAIAVLAIVRSKAEGVANNICTQADGTNCK